MDIGTKFSALKREYTLYFDNRAFRCAEKNLGHPLSAMQDSIGSLTILLHAGLLRHHPSATIEIVDDIIDDLGYEKITDIVGEAMAVSPPLRSEKKMRKGDALADALDAYNLRVEDQKKESLRIEDLRKKILEEETLRGEILKELSSQA
ncbi:MAG: hypothetical protein DDT37_01618 [Firmicutes bacterium]|nr:hypothetical protein [candidate division NPL-UPA2 bacterium]